MNWNAQLKPSSAAASVSSRVTWVVCLVACVLTGCKPPTTGRVQGYIEGEFIYVASPLAATLKELSVERGQRVKSGDPLFRLEATAEEATRDEALRKWNQAKSTVEDLKKGRRLSEVAALEAQKDQAKIALDYAAKELARQQKLRDAEGAATEQALDAAKSIRDQAAFRFAQLESELQTAKLGAREDQIAASASAMEAAQATLARAEWTLAQSVRSSPVEGTVTDTLYRPGEFVSSGKPVVVLLPPTQLKLRTFLPEPWLSSVHTGDLLQVFVDGVREPIPATVRFISPRAEFTAPAIYTRDNRAKFVFLVEASFEPAAAAQVHPGQPVDVLVPAIANARP